MIIVTSRDEAASLRITTDDPSENSGVKGNTERGSTRPVFTVPEVYVRAVFVNDQEERLGIRAPGLLTFDNAARSSQPSQKAAPCARAESRKGTGEPPHWGESGV
ncbi:hypothetical protein GCM10010220_05840 [Streptomyces parvulus]|nr:hypothetical protein GCM10010220_05840 [Streptomyces parvulus]